MKWLQRRVIFVRGCTEKDIREFDVVQAMANDVEEEEGVHD